MAVRKLPSGKWQGIVRNSSTGKRETKAFTLKQDAKSWERDRLNALARGVVHDPRRGQVTVSEWSERWWAARVVAPSTRRGDESTLNTHILPRWGRWQLAGITRLEVQQWVRELEQAGTGAQAIRRAYNLFRVMLQAAVDDERLASNPCMRVTLPRIAKKPPAYFTPAEVDAMVDGRRDAAGRVVVEGLREPLATMTLLMCWAGLRWGEAAGLHAHRVDFLKGRLWVTETVAQDGSLQEYPKTSKSRRPVPVPSFVLERMARLVEGRDREALVFVTPRQKRPLSGANYRTAFKEKLGELGIDYRSPHTCRHTAASWLVQDGVPLYDVQAFLGHESITTTMRYAHLAPDAHDKIEGAWERIQGARKAKEA